jgi:purine-binding chemotaxis protein CheW
MKTGKQAIDWENIKRRLEGHQSLAVETDQVSLKRRDEVFRERAARFAHRRHKREHTITSPVIVFRLENERFGVELRHVEQVFPRVPITSVPDSPRHLLGVASLHGQVRSIIDLRKLMELADRQSEEGYVILLRTGRAFVGIWVDQVEEVCLIDLKSLSLIDDAWSDRASSFSRGMTADHIIVLDAESLVARIRDCFTNPDSLEEEKQLVGNLS